MGNLRKFELNHKPMVKFRIALYIAIFHFYAVTNIQAQQLLKIMPLGNSITYDNNSLDGTNPRPDGDRISYRYHLYQLITNSGYLFDFVGSENTGINYFQDPEMDDHAGFPGITDDQLAVLINTGYNERAAQYESPGPYLQYYPADIILLHIGTNALEASAGDVEDILDMIRLYDNNVIVLVARIINRATYSSLTTTFNNNVEAMVNARCDDRIIMVNMETGAGINYSTDMADNLHPNQTGYNKMAAKWFEAIDNLNTAPDVFTIPQQTTNQGTPFENLNLDNYVVDNEDPASLIQWTVTSQSGSELCATIDANRVLHVSVNDDAWYGTETLTLKATDSGNGAFQKSDSTQVIYTVIKSNDPPVITSTPTLNTNEDVNYSYTLTAIDNDNDPLVYSVLQKPDWLTFSASTQILSGRPSNVNVGTETVTLRVSDGEDFTDQTFQLTVTNVNDLPIITSTPGKSAYTGELYFYELTATDIDIGDVLTYSATLKPDWLSFENGILTGTPSMAHVGSHGIILKVGDGHSEIIQAFTLIVSIGTYLHDANARHNTVVYPNPAHDILHFKCEPFLHITLTLYNNSGIMLKEVNAKHNEEIRINISEFSEGIYLYKAIIDDKITVGKFIKCN